MARAESMLTVFEEYLRTSLSNSLDQTTIDREQNYLSSS